VSELGKVSAKKAKPSSARVRDAKGRVWTIVVTSVERDDDIERWLALSVSGGVPAVVSELGDAELGDLKGIYKLLGKLPSPLAVCRRFAIPSGVRRCGCESSSESRPPDSFRHGSPKRHSAATWAGVFAPLPESAVT
jgi:hypothetical protein